MSQIIRLHRLSLFAAIAIVALLSFDVAAAAQERFEFQDFGFNRQIVRVGQSYSLGEGESVREIHSGLADITIAGTVEYDVVVIVGSLRLTNTAKIGGNVLVIGGTLTIDSGASVARDMAVIGGNLDAPA